MENNHRVVRCTKCDREGPAYEFPQDRDFFQKWFISGCANSDCDNSQSPGQAALRMMPGHKSPFVYVDETPHDVPMPKSALAKVMDDAEKAS